MTESGEKEIREVLRLCEFSDGRLVEFAEKKHGFVGDEGAYGVAYHDDYDEYQIEVEGKVPPPPGFVMIFTWPDEEVDVPVKEVYYLQKLSEHLLARKQQELAERVKSLMATIADQTA